MSRATSTAYDQTDELIKAVNPWYWAHTEQIRLGAGWFSLQDHEFQVLPMSLTDARTKVIRKATQVGFTEMEVLRSLWALRYQVYPLGILYLFPTRDEVADFSSTRFKPLIMDNLDQIGQFVRDTDRTHLKQIQRAFLYFRSGSGLRPSTIKSIPVDHCVHDEYDEMSPEIDEFVDGRMVHSEIKTKDYLANPTLPDYGIDKKFQQSSQEYWHVKCEACGEFTCFDVDENFPRLFHLYDDGTCVRVCQKCERPVDVRIGEWVAAKPAITDIRGFTIGHPSIHWVNPAELLKKFRNPDLDIANFTRLALGRAYVEAENRLSIEEVLACCAKYGVASSSSGPCSMGVDQGKDLHVVIGRRSEQRAGMILYVSVHKDWDELDCLMRKFNVSRCVVDALPETRNARAFSDRFPGRVFLNYYNEHQKGSYRWNEQEMTVQCNRTESLDASHREVMDGNIFLPKDCEIVRQFAKHLHNVAKKLIEEERKDPGSSERRKTGTKRYVYVKLGPDHFRHAFNYEAMARQSMSKMRFSHLL